LDITAIGKAGLARLACDLGIINQPGQCVLQGISQTACIHLIDKGADGYGAVVSEEGARALLVDERGDGDVPVRGEGVGGAELMKDFNE
jgi:hypothetical protein